MLEAGPKLTKPIILRTVCSDVCSIPSSFCFSRSVHVTPSDRKKMHLRFSHLEGLLGEVRLRGICV